MRIRIFLIGVPGVLEPAAHMLHERFAFCWLDHHPFVPRYGSRLHHYLLRSEKLQAESSPRFANFCPELCTELCSEFPPKFSRSFHSLFLGKRRRLKIDPKSPPFSMPNPHETLSERVTTCFLANRQGKILVS